MAVCCDGSKNLEWSILIINCMLIIFLTAVKAIQLYLIGTSSRFLMFSRRIYSCKKQNNAEKSQTAHAGMATSPTTRAHSHSSSGTGAHNECFCWGNCTMSFVFIYCGAQMFPSGCNVMDFLEPYLNDMHECGWRFQLSIQQHSHRSAFLLSLCSC